MQTDMKKKILQLLSIGTMTAVLCVFSDAQAPVVSRALERNGAKRMTNYAPLYLDPVAEESRNDGSGTGTGTGTGTGDAGTGTTIIDPTQVGGDNAGQSGGTDNTGIGNTQDGSGQQNAGSQNQSGTGSPQDSSTQGQSGTGTSQDGTGNSETGASGEGSSADGAGTGTSGDGTGAAGSGTGTSGAGSSTGDGSGTAGGGSSSAANAGSNATISIPTSPYTANVNTQDMPATGVEDLRRGVVSLILVLFGIVTILISIPTLKGKRRTDR